MRPGEKYFYTILRARKLDYFLFSHSNFQRFVQANSEKIHGNSCVIPTFYAKISTPNGMLILSVFLSQ